MKSDAAATVQDRLGYRFRNRDSSMALTHSSPARGHYQRQEFLGDRVLGLAIAEMLCHLSEGIGGRPLPPPCRSRPQGNLRRSRHRLDLGSALRFATAATPRASLLTDQRPRPMPAKPLSPRSMRMAGSTPHALHRRDWSDKLTVSLTGRNVQGRACRNGRRARGSIAQLFISRRAAPTHDPRFDVEAPSIRLLRRAASAEPARAEQAAAAALLTREVSGAPSHERHRHPGRFRRADRRAQRR